MQSNFEIADLPSQQHFMDTNSSSPVLPIFFTPQNQNHPSFHRQLEHQQLGHHHLVHPTPITHELFQGLHPQPEQEQSGTLHWQMSPINFKLGLNENSASGEVALLDENSPLFLQSRPQNLGFKSWQPQEFCTRKEPFWKPHETQGMKQKQATEGEICKELESKYRLYGELEAIYSLGKIGEVNNKQTGSGSALTNENSPKNVDLVPVPFGGSHGLNGGPAATAGVDDGSEASIDEEVSYRKVQKRKRKRRMKEQLSSSTTRFFEGLVKRVMDHQESLHHKYLALIEKMDRERREREAAWRLQEAEKHKRKAIAQLHEQALASKRESLIVSYIEKITGQKVNIPSRETPSLLQCDYSNGAMEEELTPVKVDQTNSRWPQSEVEALILVRSNIESKFQEPGLKGPLWEQVSASMDSLGYQRSAKRCKEKWENINKYFRKTKDSPKKRPQQSKTCSYFNKLDQLYSRTPVTNPSSSSYCSSNPVVSIERQGYSELLQAVLDGSETQNLSSGNFEILSEIGSNRLDFDGITNGKVEHLREDHGKEKENHEDDGSMEEEDIDGNDSDE
ncbi:putative transcription factor MYB family [Rosa chinensis]|uniref:Putative transcription factor MYB family n=1 Tax=Rosa chinensis TaxID=74649 RepID=A0A2P6Q1N0_ROSCH|nr:trihelix transcription factor GT-2 [Rosa chinensis]PRQ28039.1 putative transcription factor MYB family [Rosa chinensis]